MAIFYTAYYESPIGKIQLTADEVCITELSFTEELKTDLTGESLLYPPVVTHCIQQLDEFFKGQRKEFTVPVRQAGTDFQQRVWNELVTIPFGKTVSYLSLSKRLGDVKAIRAVAASNGKNKISILVPCHRVIGSDQSLVGYAWGAWRKQWLLEHEAKLTHGIQTLF